MVVVTAVVVAVTAVIAVTVVVVNAYTRKPATLTLKMNMLKEYEVSV